MLLCDDLWLDVATGGENILRVVDQDCNAAFASGVVNDDVHDIVTPIGDSEELIWSMMCAMMLLLSCHLFIVTYCQYCCWFCLFSCRCFSCSFCWCSCPMFCFDAMIWLFCFSVVCRCSFCCSVRCCWCGYCSFSVSWCWRCNPSCLSVACWWCYCWCCSCPAWWCMYSMSSK